MIFVSLGPSFRQRFLSKQQSMYIEDFIVSRRSGLRGRFSEQQGLSFCQLFSEPVAVYVRWRCQWQPYNCAYCMIFVSLGPSFRQRFLSKQQSMYIEDFIVSRRSGLIGWFLCAWVLVFGNGFWASNSLCTLNISSSVLELVFEDDFQNSMDSVFANCFWASTSLCALKMSVAAVELGLLDDFCVRGS